MEPWKDVTRWSWNGISEEFEARTKKFRDLYLAEDIDKFLHCLDGSYILDVGSGPGVDSEIFRDRGYRPVAVDLAPDMVAMAKEKGLHACVMDLEDLAFKDESFYGVWAYTSLLSIPKKAFPNALQEVRRVLKPKGILLLGMREGDHDEMYQRPKSTKGPVWMAEYSPEEVKEHLTNSGFHELGFSIHPSERATYMHFLYQKS